MVLPHGTGDLYHKYRPRKFGEVSGHPEAMCSIRSAMSNPDRPKVYLLSGSTGSGKTSTARIMTLALNCTNKSEGEPCLSCGACKSILTGNCMDILELNAADHRGINDARTIYRTIPMLPMLLDIKVVILDECHALTKDAQTSFLKMLEDAPTHVVFILCSTHASKILPALRNRCQAYTFGPLKRSVMASLLEEVTTLEGECLTKPIYEAIIDATGGSPRAALVALQQVLQLGSRDVRSVLKLVGGADEADGNIVKICFAINNQRQGWQDVVSAYKEVSHFGAPAIGMFLAGFYRNQLLKSGHLNVQQKLQLFLDPFAEGKIGENQLVNALHKAKHGH